MDPKIISKQKDRTTNHTWYGKPYGKPKQILAEKDIRSVSLGSRTETGDQVNYVLCSYYTIYFIVNWGI